MGNKVYYIHVLDVFMQSTGTELRGRPEISTFSTYEITSHKRGEGVAKNVDNLITFYSIFNVEKNSQTCVKMNVNTCDGLSC